MMADANKKTALGNKKQNEGKIVDVDAIPKRPMTTASPHLRANNMHEQSSLPIATSY